MLLTLVFTALAASRDRSLPARTVPDCSHSLSPLPVVLAHSAALLHQPICRIPFISHLFISPLAVLSSPAPYEVSVLSERI